MKPILLILAIFLSGCSNLATQAVNEETKALITVKKVDNSYIVSTRTVQAASTEYSKESAYQKNVLTYPDVKTEINHWSEAAVEVINEGFTVEHVHQFNREQITLKTSLGIRLKLRVIDLQGNSIRVQALLCQNELTSDGLATTLIPVDATIELNKETEVYKTKKKFFRTNGSI